MSPKITEREYVLRVIQDLRVKLRDEEDLKERMKLKSIIRKFEKGFKEEFETS
ncbi:MAG: hypothetical protein ACTSRZ_14215 [Promethearchaeota archaeon]